MKGQYIRTLPKETQELVEKELRAQGLSEEDVQTGMDSRICDLSDTIDIKKII